MAKQGVLLRYRDLLPVNADTPLFSLGEGDTPLIRSRRLENKIGCGSLYYKLEGCNPTGSFKDRGMVVAIAKALEEGSRAVICASTGNTSASAAAYAASSALDTVIVIPEGKIALGKLAQAIVHGAKIIAIDGNFDQALKIVRSLTQKHPVTLVNSINPNRIEGQKTASFEVVDEMGSAPDYLFIPVGNAGNITAYWKGFVEYYRLGKIKQRPKMMGFQAEGAAPIVRGHVIDKPETVATAIRIGNPASWQNAVVARDESGGVIDMVSDEEILEAYHLLASGEGIFCEPASAASVAGLIKITREGMDLSENSVVCILTGSGLKDTDTATKEAPSFARLPANMADVEKDLGWD
ncbi:MAG: threonine synthase [Dehalococcoidia bacterium]|nr:MAG: threonine synthase [Dehalococcoidia bacterium]